MALKNGRKKIPIVPVMPFTLDISERNHGNHRNVPIISSVKPFGTGTKFRLQNLTSKARVPLHLEYSPIVYDAGPTLGQRLVFNV